ncbi:MAG: hypothetical protein A2148_01420 [Chloroflexi bacterium RBG_16_68_14]|nr:MAG: hypothetical protein A2148_01420 [Chloroflexi bacterium RBG_16_68_14]
MEWLASVFPIMLILLACPLLMWFMMRGMHGQHGAGTPHDAHGRTARDDSAEQKLTALEREVVELRRLLAARSDTLPASAPGRETQPAGPAATGLLEARVDGATPSENAKPQQPRRE